MKNKAVFKIILLILIIFMQHNSELATYAVDGLQQPDYTGTFTMESGDVTITLVFNQDPTGNITGKLTSSNGSVFQLEGTQLEGVATGVCQMDQGGVFFEAFLSGDDLSFALIEPDENNMPDYDRAQYMVMNRISQNKPNAGLASSPMDQLTQSPTQNLQDNRQLSHQDNQSENITPQQQVTNASAPPSGFNAAAAGSMEVRDDINGYSFTKPDGWNHQVDEGYILLGSNTIPGLILVFPHQAPNFQSMVSEMNTGVQEEGISLNLSSQVQPLSGGMANCYLQGIVQGEQAKAYGLGLQNPAGGGIYILAISTPEKLGKEIEAAANSISQNTSFFKPKTGDINLVKHFSGEWAWSNGYRTQWMMLYPDGSFSDQYEASYSGNMSDAGGNITGNWGASNQEKSQGRWTVQGNKDSGVITVINLDGTQTRYEYNVFVEHGEKFYWEYMFNGYHYRKNKAY